MQKQTKLRGADHCTSAGRMNSILRHVAGAFPPARQGTILHNHRLIGIATNTSMMLSYALVTYRMMTAEVGLPDAIYHAGLIINCNEILWHVKMP